MTASLTRYCHQCAHYLPPVENGQKHMCGRYDIETRLARVLAHLCGASARGWIEAVGAGLAPAATYATETKDGASAARAGVEGEE